MVKNVGMRDELQAGLPMKICHYASGTDTVQGGITTSIKHQQKALAMTDIEVTDDPSDDYDLLHINIPLPQALYRARKARKQDIPVVMHTHVTGEDFRKSFRFSNLLAPAVGWYTRRAYAKADRLIAPSTYTRELLNDTGIGVPIDVVSNGIDTERFDGTDELEGMKEKHGTTEPTVINLGMVFERKGLSDFIEVARRTPDIDYRWFGPQLSGLLRSRTTKKALKSPPQNARFPGFIDDIREAMALGDIFFWPTYEENQGISLLEASYCGLAPVIRDIPTYEGWFEDGVNCLKADGVDGFVECIERLRDDPELREEIGANARDLAEEHTLDVVGDQLRSVYRSCLETG